MRTAQSKVTAVFRALGDDTRLQMLVLLGRREFCVCEFVELFGISQSAISEHLRRLKEAGLAADERRGMWVFYRLRGQLPAFVTAALKAVELQPEIVERLGALQPAGAMCGRTLPDQAAILGAANQGG